MKKIQFSLFGVILISSAVAHASSFCGYTDHVHIEGASDLFIVGVSHDENVRFEVVDSTNFDIKDTESCLTGSGRLIVSNKNLGWCLLDIKDGPYMFDPEIKATCTNLKYKGDSHPGAYKYILTFE